ncbi:MAG: NAD(P)/FAD-dependent oxidoreductase [Micromonosporaceae bacterium]
MRVCVIGGGLAGSLLAWRLRLAVAPLGEHLELDLVCGREAGDATDVSLGMVRGFESDAASCRLATDSLAELRANRRLAAWAGLQELESVYVNAESPDHADIRLRRLMTRLSGAARTAGPDELAHRYGIAGLPDRSVGVVEPRAGAIVPGRLRRSVLAELARLQVPRIPGPVDQVATAGDQVVCRWHGRARRYDAVVLATGRWTPHLLAASDLPVPPYRTKVITYAWYPATGAPRYCFVDETTGLYGRPGPDGQLALGLPSSDWDVDPDRPTADDEGLHHRAVELARSRFPALRLESPHRVVTSADCYTEPSGLTLRPVLDDGTLLYTFTGGSGGAAKTALAASAVAARDLLATLSGRDTPAVHPSLMGRLT